MSPALTIRARQRAARWVTPTCSLLFLSACFPSSVQAETLTLPSAKRPAWVQRDGVIMAGSWEPLPFRVRRDGAKGYEPTPEQAAAYAREHSPEMVAQLKALGVNFVMMHAYKGLGLNAERQSMDDAVQFARLCHEAGLRVGVYNYSGAFGWELFFKEHPEARDWLVLDQSARPVPYDSSAQYRYFWNRNHPEAQAFYKELVRFAIRDIQSDLIHFDNYNVGPGFDSTSVRQFRNYLRKTFTRRELHDMGFGNINSAFPPTSEAGDNLQRRAWLDFSCQSLADSYHAMARYARSLRIDILVECNPNGPGRRITPPVDHGRILTGGEAFWEEDVPPGYRNGVLQSRIRTYKLGRSLDNLVFTYTTTPLELAESMAFNLDCLGSICWFEYGKLVALPGSTAPVSSELAPFVRFFTTQRDLFRNARVVTDVAVLRNFASQAFADPRWSQFTGDVEQNLIENRVPFQLIYDQQLSDLSRFRALVLAGCLALSDYQLKLLKRYVADGGCLCILGPVGTHDEWLRPRSKPALDDLPSARAFRFPETTDCLAAVRQSCTGRLSLSIEAPLGVCAELTEQPGRRLVHLVNYSPSAPVTNAMVNVMLPTGRSARSVMLASPEREQVAKLPFEQSANAVAFTVPKVGVYEIAIIELR